MSHQESVATWLSFTWLRTREVALKKVVDLWFQVFAAIVTRCFENVPVCHLRSASINLPCYSLHSPVSLPPVHRGVSPTLPARRTSACDRGGRRVMRRHLLGAGHQLRLYSRVLPCLWSQCNHRETGPEAGEDFQSQSVGIDWHGCCLQWRRKEGTLDTEYCRPCDAIFIWPQ